jgi:hypothetical protein
VFAPDEEFHCVGNLSNAPDDTKLKAVWTAVDVQSVDPNTRIDEASATGGDGRFQFDLTNNGPWPAGKYKVDLFLNEDEEPAQTLEFRVQ